jgi:DNA repair exonuclease SbcCD ATPase subunit
MVIPVNPTTTTAPNPRDFNPSKMVSDSVADEAGGGGGSDSFKGNRTSASSSANSWKYKASRIRGWNPIAAISIQHEAENNKNSTLKNSFEKLAARENPYDKLRSSEVNEIRTAPPSSRNQWNSETTSDNVVRAGSSTTRLEFKETRTWQHSAETKQQFKKVEKALEEKQTEIDRLKASLAQKQEEMDETKAALAQKQEEIDKLKANGVSCMICMAEPRQIALLPCGHVVSCAACAQDNQARDSDSCPICRQPVSDRISVFIP